MNSIPPPTFPVINLSINPFVRAQFQLHCMETFYFHKTSKILSTKNEQKTREKNTYMTKRREKKQKNRILMYFEVSWEA